jgi:chaperonin GroEL
VRVPCSAIAKNAGFEGAVIVGKILEMEDRKMGFDAQNGEFCDLVELGVIDPTKVVRTALVDAASVASLMATTECAVCDMESEDGAGAGGGMPPMGGMGG